jgi:hypothetical protein
MNRLGPSPESCLMCGVAVSKAVSHCTQCGTRLTRCPLCATLVLTGPTTCTGCGTQLSLPKINAHFPEPSLSMKFLDATIFLEPQNKGPNDVLPLQQEESKPEPAGSFSSPQEADVPVLPPLSLPLSRQFCPHCGRPLQTSASFCAYCGFATVPSLATHLKTESLSAREQLQDEIDKLSASSVSPSLSYEVAPEEESNLHRVGQRLGNYQLIRFLGEGGFAEVYLGEHIHLGSRAAIKVLHGQLTRDDLETFRREARTIVRLIHPHIVRILDFGIENKRPFLVMDYAPHGTLRQVHPKGRALPLATVISYLKQVAGALQFAHDEKIIHRDIKPENMLVGPGQNVLLSDFGIATMAQSSRYYSAQDMAGTIAYMAPEQIQAHPRPASDQYSLGIVVYEWLCGERPFHGTFNEIAVKHAVIPPPPLCERVSTLPQAVEEVVLKALTKDPKDRFESVSAFATALERSCESI